ncbi:hypothetical protein FEM48_Zijuj02G0132300 [Ziziphus jujuba var. spinosa]|uniref:F-box domain-containing protein n=1 Tax=Ziziphus jujuba var. spinosa TaxID=714518 RepID=A0A978VVX7_ZIZJJ|nr:hypothetical protein FEM48_Zijuj02G0132300 [Ziziphus jujuba var. spinosa]
MSWSCREVERRVLRLLHGQKTRTHLSQIHAYFLRHGLNQSNQVLSHFVSVCGSLDKMAYANRIYHHTQNPNILLFNSMIKGYSSCGPFHQSLQMFSLMRSRGIRPDEYTFVPLLKSCSNICEYRMGQCVHAQVFKAGFEWFGPIQNGIVEFYVTCVKLKDAKKMFDEMYHRDVIAWNLMIRGFCKMGDVDMDLLGTPCFETSNNAQRIYNLMFSNLVFNWLMSEGLVIEILVRLPVDSLLRFKCVCKSWYSLIGSPFFIAKHLQLCNSTNKPDPDLMFYADDQRPGNNGVENIFIVSHETMEVSEIEEESSPHSIAESSGDESQDEDDDQAARSTVLMVGSCNGLICLYFKADGAIWNPATNETKFIPRFSGRGGHFKASGFGYDARNNDYKLIVIHSSPSIGADHNYDHDTGCFQFEAYSLRADCWKFVTDFPKMGLTFSDQLIGTHANGICSWLAHREDSIRGVRRDEIISFDIINEEIIRTPLPSEIAEIGTQLADKIGMTTLANAV